MKEIILSLIAGVFVGVLFKIIRLPLPAPPVLTGVIGIFGVYLGGVLVDWASKYFGQ
ncbi:XapX domain-containing protein [Salirhabdus euzebyi]|uniref:XapX domain-containing protein n=1 Tax=Salirhabdus euzebyi TaxID=394506 RepID=A0A841Q2C6_9BACI|nr:DUF1427 family protein [Salirhabdus euzebyi]MBB6452395.1 XapX domain-containing protein [Salirhabdus euzebyi]